MKGIPLSLVLVMVASSATVANDQAPVKPPILALPPALLWTASSEGKHAPWVAEGLSPDYSTKLPECDRIEIYLLGTELQRVTIGERFPIRPYFGTVEIIQRKELRDAEAAKLSALWRGLTFDNGGSPVLSHISDYGLRFYRQDHLVFETSVSFSCHNFYYPRTAFPMIPEGYSWHGFRNDDDAGKALFAFLNAIIPSRSPQPKS